MRQVGFAREIITPPVGLPLAGYFNPRPSQGVLDDLHARALVVEDGATAALAVCDLIFVPPEMVERYRGRLRELGAGDWADRAVLAATHTHTGPYTQPLFEYDADPVYQEHAARRAAEAVWRAWQSRRPADLSVASAATNDLAFNRRYWMKDGTVVTNPGKGNPDIDRPEGPVDREIAVLAARRGGRLIGLVVNLSNHGDAIGGDLISADWHGRMEREIQRRLGEDVPVITLIGCSGNINHFDVNSSANQCCYEESKRLGRGYGERVAAILAAGPGREAPAGAFSMKHGTLTVVGREIAAGEIARAREVVARPVEAAAGDLTSEGLAKGEGLVARFFAQQVLRFAEEGAGRKREFEWACWRMGDVFALATLPGEPFTEIGMALKRASPCAVTMVSELTMGACGYVPLPECFERGGYETMTVMKGGCRADTAPYFIETLSQALRD